LEESCGGNARSPITYFFSVFLDELSDFFEPSDLWEVSDFELSSDFDVLSFFEESPFEAEGGAEDFFA